MKITICCSLVFMAQALNFRTKLIELGHDVLLPETIVEAEKMGLLDAKDLSIKYKNENISNITQKMILHYNKIKNSDAVLVCNIDKNKIDNYIGPSTFLEMGIAFHYGKKLFLLNDIPTMNLRDEVEAMQPIIINQNLNLII